MKILSIFKSKLASNGIWLLILQGFNVVVPLITLPYITRILQPSDYGEFELSLNWIGYFQVVIEYGFGLVGARKVAIDKEGSNFSYLFTAIIIARAFLAIACFVALLVICMFVTTKTQIICLILLSLVIIATVFQTNWFFQGKAEMRPLTIINMVCRIISVVLIFLFVKDTNDLFLYCILYSSNFFISNILSIVYMRFKYRIKFVFIKLKDVFIELKNARHLFFSSALAKVFGGIGVTILGLVATKEQVGIYSAIYKIPYICIVLFSAVGQAIYPFSCEKYIESSKKGAKFVRNTALFVMIPFAFVAVILCLFNFPIVNLAFGEQYSDYSKLLIPFSIWICFSILNNFLGVQTLIASGHQKEYSIIFSINAVIMIALLYVFSRQWSVYGVAYASLLSETILSLILYFTIRFKVFKEKE